MSGVMAMEGGTSCLLWERPPGRRSGYRKSAPECHPRGALHVGSRRLAVVAVAVVIAVIVAIAVAIAVTVIAVVVAVPAVTVAVAVPAVRRRILHALLENRDAA